MNGREATKKRMTQRDDDAVTGWGVPMVFNLIIVNLFADDRVGEILETL